MAKFSLKFSANISTLFSEVDFLDRYELCKKFQFKAVETSSDCIYDYSVHKIKDKMLKADLQHDLMNTSVGILGTSGYCAHPGKEGEFMSSVSKAIEYSFHLNCKKIHILAGSIDDSFDIEDQQNTFIENLNTAAEMIEEHNIIGLIEPICPQTKPNYFLKSFEKAVEFLQKVNQPHIKLLLDVYHLQNLKDEDENLQELIKKYFPYVGHIQVSQDPGRKEPSAPGVIKYDEVFSLLEELNYCDYIGLEFSPSGTTEEALKSLKKFGIKFN